MVACPIRAATVGEADVLPVTLFGPSWMTFGGSVLLAFTLGGAGGFFKGISHEHDKAQRALLKSTQHAREVEADWQVNTQAQQELHDEELRRIAAQHVRDLAGLRNRSPERMPAAAAVACNGASPASIAAPDAAVALGFAAEFDELRSDYAACRGWVETVTGKAIKP